MPPLLFAFSSSSLSLPIEKTTQLGGLLIGGDGGI